MYGLVNDKVSMATHLGINPVRGGSPPRDSKRRGIINCINGALDINLFRSILVFDENLLNRIKIGVIKIEYIMKYSIVVVSLFIEDNLIIHPIWVIDE